MKNKCICLCIVINFLYIFLFKTVLASTPKNVRITDISATEFVISWTTDIKEKGSVSYGKSYKNMSIANDIREDFSDYIHYIRLKSLSPETLYYFHIISGETNHDRRYSVRTAKAIMLPVDLCKPSGKIIKPENSLSNSAIVYLTILENGDFSETKSTLVTHEINYIWRFDLMNFKTLKLDKKFPYIRGKSIIIVEVESGIDGVSWMLTKAIHSKNSSTNRPDMIIKDLPDPNLYGAILVLKSLAGIGNFPVLDIDNNLLDIPDVLYMLMEAKQ